MEREYICFLKRTGEGLNYKHITKKCTGEYKTIKIDFIRDIIRYNKTFKDEKFPKNRD